ncbi:MAG TPA: DUF2062 domain-containing protein [Steroidobacteraceae bacterium]|nr:DUF2062 domain-containing protein [Steroidobacteraceae bacterium]
MRRFRDFIDRRLIAPIGTLLKQGITPTQLALSLAIGLVVGVFPVLGATTVLCTLAAFCLRLNLLAVHAVHYAATPIQLLLIIPFVRLGEHLVGVPPQPLSISSGLALIDQGVIAAVTTLWDAIVHAVLGWLLIAPFAICITYAISRPLLSRMSSTPRHLLTPGPTS